MCISFMYAPFTIPGGTNLQIFICSLFFSMPHWLLSNGEPVLSYNLRLICKCEHCPVKRDVHCQHKVCLDTHNRLWSQSIKKILTYIISISEMWWSVLLHPCSIDSVAKVDLETYTFKGFPCKKIKRPYWVDIQGFHVVSPLTDLYVTIDDHLVLNMWADWDNYS